MIRPHRVIEVVFLGLNAGQAQVYGDAIGAFSKEFTRMDFRFIEMAGVQ